MWQLLEIVGWSDDNAITRGPLRMHITNLSNPNPT
jgi:hypothetical protein